VIEKHITLDRHLPGPDQSASLEPDELAAMVRGIRKVERALGSGRKMPAKCEANTALVARKSLVAAVDIPAGAVIKKDMITIKRPGTGLLPTMRAYLIGRTARISILKGEVIRLEMMI
ncbi:MAG: N-acetylneuraminate synthase family protein, partial [Methanothrix sp.]